MAEEFNLKFKLSLENKNELSDTLKRAERDAKSFTSNLQKGILDAGKQIAGFTASTAKSLSQLATGDLGIASNAKRVLELRNSIAQLSVTAGLGAGGIEGLRKEIHRVSQASNQMQDDVTEAFASFVAKTGDIDTARKNMELYGRVATATGASLKDVANVGVELKDKLGIKEQAAAMAILVQQAKIGAVEFKDMATVGPKILAAAAMAGATGEAGISGAGAAVQLIAKGFGGRGQGASAAVSYENVLKSLQQSKTRGRIEDMGIKVAGRDANEVIMDIVRKTGGDSTRLREIFTTVQAFRGISSFAKDLHNPEGEFATFKKFRTASSDKGVIDADFNTMRSTGLAQLNASQIKIAKTIDDNVGPAFERLASHADKLATGFEFLVKHPYMTGAGAVTGLVAANIAKNTLSELISGGKGGGGLLGGLVGKGGVQHVWVDNLGPGGLPSGPGSPGGKGGAAAKILPLVGAAVGGYQLGNELGADNGALARGFNSSDRDIRRGMREAAIDDAFDRRTGGAGVRLRAPTPGQLAAAQAAANVNNHITVVVDGDKATVTDDSGTRSTATLKRRSVGGPR